MVKIYLKKGKEESLKRFHPWIFSGAISRTDGDPQEGDMVDVYTSSDNFIAKGHCQIGSISVRILTFKDEIIDTKWWQKRFSEAYSLRKAIGLVGGGDTNCYRLIHGEGDSLPGLVVDIYNTTAVVQAHSIGMYLSMEQIKEAILNVCEDKIESIYCKSKSTLPFNSGVDVTDGFIYGSNISSNVAMENALKFNVNWEEGQKTGFFIDQRDNRELVKRYSKGRKVLNTFCYTGGFSIYAISGGATEVVSVDSSVKAVELAVENMNLNFGDKANHKGITIDAFDYLKDMDDTFDLIILDPPAFAKHHKAANNALQGYKRINAQAIRKIKPGGILFTFSCSQAIDKQQFRNAVFSAAAIAGREVRILHQLTQPADHPVNIYHPEGEYLKGLVVYVE